MTEMDWATWTDEDTGVMQMDGGKWSIYSGDPQVERLSSHPVSSHDTTKIHSPFLPTVDLTRSFEHFVDPHGRGV